MNRILSCILLLGLAVNGCVAQAKYTKVADIQRINLGDTFDQVIARVGEPNQMVTKNLTKDGQEEVVWLYESIARPYDAGGIVRPSPEDVAKWEKAYQEKIRTNPPYLVTFLDGKVSKISRQR